MGFLSDLFLLHPASELEDMCQGGCLIMRAKDKLAPYIPQKIL